MRPELRPLVRPLALRRVDSGSGASFSGTLGRLEIAATITGIGTGAAARAAERVLDAGAVDHLVVVGIAGGIGASVAIGDLVVPERVVDLATDSEYRPAALGDVAPRGTLVTSDGLLADRGELRRLAETGAVAIDMETAAIAAVCERRGCAWSVFRGISDRADDGSMDEAVFGLAGPDGSGDFAAVARFLLTRPWRIPQLVRLARGMDRAANAAAAAAVRALGSL
jgi:nucleoside phosphorylase